MEVSCTNLRIYNKYIINNKYYYIYIYVIINYYYSIYIIHIKYIYLIINILYLFKNIYINTSNNEKND